jgi:hypothetical protein
MLTPQVRLFIQYGDGEQLAAQRTLSTSSACSHIWPNWKIEKQIHNLPPFGGEDNSAIMAARQWWAIEASNYSFAYGTPRLLRVPVKSNHFSSIMPAQ